MAIRLPSHAPSSPQRASRMATTTGPTPGIERMMAVRRARLSSAARRRAISASSAASLPPTRSRVLGGAGDPPARVPPREDGLGAGPLVLEAGRLRDGALTGLYELCRRLHGHRRRRSRGGRRAGGEEGRHARVEPTRRRRHADRLGEKPGPERARDRRGVAAGVQAAMRAARCRSPFSGRSIHRIDLCSASPSIAMSPTSWPFSRRLGWRWPEAASATRKKTQAGRMRTSRLPSRTSAPTCDLARASRSDGFLRVPRGTFSPSSVQDESRGRADRAAPRR